MSAGDEAGQEAPTAISFTVRYTSSDQKFPVTVPLKLTVLDLKTKLSTAEFANVPVDRQRLIYAGKVLKDADTLDTYKIKEGNTVHLVQGRDNNAAQPTPGASPAAAAAGASPAAARPVVPNMATGTGTNNPLAGLTGARYAGLAQLPGREVFGPDGGMGPPASSDQMLSMLENPSFRQQMDEMLSNPQVVDMIIQQDPIMRSMGPQAREMFNNPEFRRMMTDPASIRASMQANSMFGGGGGRFGGGSGMPAPGVTDTTEPGAAGTQPGQQGQQGQQAQRPFGFPMGGTGGMGGNPFAMLFGQRPSQTQGQTDPTTDGSNAQGQQNQQNPFGANPFMGMGGGQEGGFGGMMNSPSFQQAMQNLMNNPEQTRNMMQAMGLMPAGGSPYSAAPQSSPAQGGEAGANTTNPSSPPPTNPFANLFNMMGGMQGMQGLGGFNEATSSPPDNRPPEERYADQLRQLNDMGFFEFERNIEALRRSGGSVQGAVEYLLSS